MENTPQKPQEKASIDYDAIIAQATRKSIEFIEGCENDYLITKMETFLAMMKLESEVRKEVYVDLTHLRARVEELEGENARCIKLLKEFEQYRLVMIEENTALKQKADKWDEIMKMCKDRAEKCSIEFLQHKPIELKNLKNPES